MAAADSADATRSRATDAVHPPEGAAADGVGDQDESEPVPELEAFLDDKRAELDQTTDRPDDRPAGAPDSTDTSIDALVDRPEVQEAMNAAWERSDVDDYDTRHEEGGWIVVNDQTTEVRTVDVAPGVRAGLRPGPRPELGPNERIAAFFHTHPNPRIDEIGNRWNPENSRADMRWSDRTGIPSIVRNRHGTSIYDPSERA